MQNQKVHEHIMYWGLLIQRSAPLVNPLFKTNYWAVQGITEDCVCESTDYSHPFS